MLADNRIAEKSNWNNAKLEINFTTLKKKRWNTKLTGFKDTNLKKPELKPLHKGRIIGGKTGEKLDEDIPEEEPEYNEDVADDVEMIKCPECGHEFPK